MKIFSFYRIRDWIKSLGFSIIGLSILSKNPFLFFIGLIQSCFLYSFLFSINDFFDYSIKKEKNYIENLITKKLINKNLALLLCFLPLILSIIPLILNFSFYYLIFYTMFVFFSLVYSIPKIRLRDIAVVDIFCNILFFCLIFIQLYFFVNSKVDSKLYFFLFWIIFYIFSQELIHQLSHFKNDKITGRTSTVILLNKRKSRNILKISFILPIIFGILVYLLLKELELFAIVMIFFNIMRFLYVYKFNENSDFNELRNELGGTIEGIIYFILILFSAY